MIPEAEYRFADYLDGDGVSGRPYRVALTLRRLGGRVELDASASDDQGQGPINYMTHLGLVQMAYGRWLLPEFSYFVLFGPMAVLLLFRPRGIFGRDA